MALPLAPLIAGGASLAGGLLGGLFGGDVDTSASDEARNGILAMFGDPNSPFYRQATASFQRQITEQAPTTSSLLGLAVAMGGGFGGSQALANRQRAAIESRLREATGQFGQQLFTSGAQITANALNQWAERQLKAQMQEQAGRQQLFSGLASAGGGLLGIGLSGGSGTYQGVPASVQSQWTPSVITSSY